MNHLFSVIIPTINREYELNLMLSSLVYQTLKDFDVIVVDQNKNLDITPIINKYNGELILKHIKCPPCGASAARNVGFKYAKGKFITFPDDDCEFPENLLEKIIEVFSEKDDLDGISIITKDKNDGKMIARLKSKRVSINKKNILSTIIEAGIVVRRDSVGNILFDENMGVGSSSPYWSDEGPDFVLHLLKKGKHLDFIPYLYMFHPNPTKIYDNKAAKRAYQYGMGRGYFLKKNDYPFFVVIKYLLMYFIGIGIGIFKMNKGMINYFFCGLKGRLRGYYGIK